jgi:hypothetical protein
MKTLRSSLLAKLQKFTILPIFRPICHESLKFTLLFQCFHYLVQIFAWLFDEFSRFSSSVDISSSIASSLNPFCLLFPISSYLKFTEFLFFHKIKIINFLFFNSFDRPARSLQLLSYTLSYTLSFCLESEISCFSN